MSRWLEGWAPCFEKGTYGRETCPCLALGSGLWWEVPLPCLSPASYSPAPPRSQTPASSMRQCDLAGQKL